MIDAKMILNDAYENNIKVEFICHFKGIPLVQKANIDKFTKNYILFNTFSTQVVAIKETGHVFVIHPQYKDDVIEAKFLEIKKGEEETVSLYDFTLCDSHRVLRQKLRVVPDDKFVIQVIDALVKIHTPRIVDISSQTISLSFSKLPSTIHMESFFHVKISFKPNKDFKTVTVALKCKPIRIGEVGGRARIIADFIDLTDDKKKLLDEYLKTQQLRILNEFKLIKNIELGKI